MKIKLLTLLTAIIGTTAATADVRSFDGYSPKTINETNTCGYVGVGVGNPDLGLNLGGRKQWGYNGIDVGISGETTQPLRKAFSDVTQLTGYANYLFFPQGTNDASFYLGAGASGGVKMARDVDTNEIVGAGNLLLGRSFANKQFVQAKVGFPLEFDQESRWKINSVASKPTLTVSYGIGF